MTSAPSPTPRHTDPNDRSIRAPWENGKPVYRGSTAGNCPRELLLHRLGIRSSRGETSVTSSDPWAITNKGILAAREGSRHERWIVEDLISQGYEVKDAGDGDEQISLYKKFKRYIVRSHPDGRIRGKELGSTWHVLECKALNQDSYDRWQSYGWDAFNNYACQVSLEMDLSKSPALFIVKNRNTGEMSKNIITVPPIAPVELYRKFSLIEDVAETFSEGEEISKDDLPECGPEAEWFFCPFMGDQLCEVAVRAVKGGHEVEDEEFEEILDFYRRLKEQEKEIEVQVKNVRSLIEERMIEPRLYVGRFFSSLSERIRRSFDGRAAEEHLQRLGVDTSVYWREKGYTELRVTEPKSRQGGE